MKQINSRYLDVDEEILWEGIPQRGHLMRKRDFYALIPLFALAIYLFSGHQHWMPYRRDIAFIPFSLVVLFVFLRFIFVPLRRRKSLYVVTDRRVIVKTWEKVRQMELKNPYPIYFKEFKDGNGRISFGEFGFIPILYYNGARGIQGIWGCLELDNISDARSVYNLICDINKSLNAEEYFS